MLHCICDRFFRLERNHCHSQVLTTLSMAGFLKDFKTVKKDFVFELTDCDHLGECAEEWDLLRCIAKYSCAVSSLTRPRCRNLSILLASCDLKIALWKTLPELKHHKTFDLIDIWSVRRKKEKSQFSWVSNIGDLAIEFGSKYTPTLQLYCYRGIFYPPVAHTGQFWTQGHPTVQTAHCALDIICNSCHVFLIHFLLLQLHPPPKLPLLSHHIVTSPITSPLNIYNWHSTFLFMSINNWT